MLLSMNAERSVVPLIREDLLHKMVFLAGPRQVGKTTLAQSLIESDGPGSYFSYDNVRDRKLVLDARWPAPPALIVLDEFHKYRFWKRWLKGEYDVHKKDYRFLVTGSARMDVYRRGGDSLQGRYHHIRLHPFSMKELAGGAPSATPYEPLPIGEIGAQDTLEALLQRGGFPEPLFAATDRHQRRWQKERNERFFREDVRDLESIRDLSSLQLLSELLPERVGSPLSVNSLREVLQVSHRAVSHWLDVFERLYFSFRIAPYTGKLERALHKETKLYLWDWSLIADAGARFENLIASHLLKLCHYLEDAHGFDARLCYIRDKEKREVDFVVTVKRKPWFAVEAKLSETTPSPALTYFTQRLQVPFAFQVVKQPGVDFVKGQVRVLSVARFLNAIA